MSEIKPIIAVKNLTHTYPNGFVSLKNVSLDIFSGEFVAFIGQNGSGKTTLAKHFVGLLSSGKGKVLVEGKDVYRVPIVELALKVGYVFQNADNQIFSSSVQDEVSYGPKNLRLNKSEIDDRVNQKSKRAWDSPLERTTSTCFELGRSTKSSDCICFGDGSSNIDIR